MEMAEALSARPNKRPKNVLQSIMLHKAENGGVVAEHRMSQFHGKEPMHVFGANEGHKLAAHLTEHLGIAMPGKAEEEE